MAQSLALNVANPIWEYIDEPSHFQYAKFIAEHHGLPPPGTRLPDLTLSGSDCGVIHCVARNDVTSEPPLYYILVAPMLLPIDLESHASWVANPYFTWPNHPLRNGVAVHTLSEQWPYRGMVLGVHVMRAASAVMVAGAIAAIYFAAHAVGGRRFGLLAAGTAAAVPGVLLSSAGVNNDNAAILTGSLAFLAAVKSITSRPMPWLIVFGASLLLALAAKNSGAFLIVVAAGAAFVLISRGRARKSAWLASAGAMVALIAAATLLGQRYRLLHSIFEIPQMIARAGSADWPCDCTLPAQRYWGAIPNFWETFWGSYGWETFHIPADFYKPLLLVTLLGIAGLIYAAIRAVRAGSLGERLTSGQGLALLLLGAGFLTLFLMVDFRYLATHSDGGSTHGRFLFPALLPMVIFLAGGLAALPAVLRIGSFLVLFGTCLAVVGYSIYALPRSFGPTAPVYGDAEAAKIQHPSPTIFVNGMELMGWSERDATPPRPGSQLHLQLLWSAARTPDFDYSAFLRLDDGSGQVISGQDHGPGKGVDFLPHVWEPGEVVPDDWVIELPPTVHAGTYALRLGLYDYRDLKPVLTSGGRDVVVIGSQNLTAAAAR